MRDNTSPNQGPPKTSNDLLPLMDLRLLDSDDTPIASEVVPLERSYHVHKFESGYSLHLLNA